MEEAVVIEQLTERVSHLETEVSGLRQEVGALRQQAAPMNTPTNGAGIAFVEQQSLSQAVAELFAELGIKAKPVGALALQQMMREAGLTANELSQGIIAAREE